MFYQCTNIHNRFNLHSRNDQRYQTHEFRNENKQKSRIRSSIFLTRSHIKSNSDSKSDKITTLQTFVQQNILQNTPLSCPHGLPLYFPLLNELHLVTNIVAFPELHAPNQNYFLQEL